MNATAFGNKIAKLRRKARMTQKELAVKLNVSDKAVSKWENGGGYPEITMLPALSEILGVSIDYLFKGDAHGIAIAGNILVDVVNIIDKYPQKNMLCNILKTTYAVGGCVPNTIINLAKIDSDMFLTAIGKVGEDENGRYVISQLRKYGVDVSGIKADASEITASSNVMSEEVSGERTFFYTSGANSSFDVDDVDIDSLDCSILHVGYIRLLETLDKKDEEYGRRMARLLAKAQAKGIKTSVDAISREGENVADEIIPTLKYCNYAILNEIESCAVTGLSPRNADGSISVENIKATMEQFIEFGVKDKVIVHCCEAGFSLDSDGKFVVVPSLKLPDGFIKGSVGAGDAYAAACLYGLYKDFDDEHLLEFAAAAAACNLMEPDSVSGMKNREEIEKLNKMYERRTL